MVYEFVQSGALTWSFISPSCNGVATGTALGNMTYGVSLRNVINFGEHEAVYMSRQ